MAHAQRQLLPLRKLIARARKVVHVDGRAVEDAATRGPGSRQRQFGEIDGDGPVMRSADQEIPFSQEN